MSQHVRNAVPGANGSGSRSELAASSAPPSERLALARSAGGPERTAERALERATEAEERAKRAVEEVAERRA